MEPKYALEVGQRVQSTGVAGVNVGEIGVAESEPDSLGMFWARFRSGRIRIRTSEVSVLSGDGRRYWISIYDHGHVEVTEAEYQSTSAQVDMLNSRSWSAYGMRGTYTEYGEVPDDAISTLKPSTESPKPRGNRLYASPSHP